MDITEPLTQINDVTIAKYKTAGLIAKKAVDQIVKNIKEHAKLIELANIGYTWIENELKTVYKDVEYKGISFPICLSKNHIAGHYVPKPEDTVKDGDVLKIELGVHIDGYSANLVYTTLAKFNTDEINPNVLNPLKAVILASKEAMKVLKPGKKNRELVQVLEKFATKYACSLPITNVPGIVPGVMSFQISQNILDGYHDRDDCVHRFILHRDNPQYDFTMRDIEFEEDEVYTIDIMMTSGSGKLGQTSKAQTQIYSRDYENMISLRLKSSKQVLSQFKGKYFPMIVNSTESQTRMGLADCLAKNLLKSYVCAEEKEGEIVARVKFTVLIKEEPILICGKPGDVELEKLAKQFKVNKKIET